MNNTPETLRRQIVVFFVVNPDVPITSTATVPPQQGSPGVQTCCDCAHGTCTATVPRDVALAHRLELMRDRKYYKGSLNIRKIELCEH